MFRLVVILLTMLTCASSTPTSKLDPLFEVLDSNVPYHVYLVFDFDSDGCYPDVAISLTEKQNPGLSPSPNDKPHELCSYNKKLL